MKILHFVLESIYILVIVNLRINHYLIFIFRLSGIAAYDTGHYLAYCRKLSGSWTKFNDLKSKPEFVSPGSEVEPHGAFYVLEEVIV